MFAQKTANALLRPIMPGSVKMNKAHVSAPFGHLQVDKSTPPGNLPRIAGRAQEGVIGSIEDQSGDTNIRQKRFATGLGPVIDGVFETVQGGRRYVVKLLKIPGG